MENSISIINEPKFKVDGFNSDFWDNLRGGWNWVIDGVKNELHSDNGTLFFKAVEDIVNEGRPIKEPWVGFLHQVPKHNDKNFPDLERLLKNDTWKESVPYCQGIYVLSSYLKDYLIEKNIPVPVNMVYYPFDDNCKKFSLTRFNNKTPKKQVLFIGEYLRDFQSFYQLKADGYEKKLLRNELFDTTNIVKNSSVTVIDRVSDSEYDELLSESIVFLKLFDAPANTLIVECIARNTPILVNRLRGVVEYLGEDYPFYYNNLAEAQKKIKDTKLIEKTVKYLENYEIKKKLERSYFINSIRHSSIYRSLPAPKKNDDEFQEYDVSIIMCSYKRVYNIENILERFCKQDFDGTFELLLWNNNFEEQENLNKIYDKFKDRLPIKLIHSSENYYCVIRMAVTSLMRSDVLLITDDDVLPSSSYVSTFMNKYKEYGKDAILCCRGHEFLEHELDEENPHLVWEHGEHMKFYDESFSDRQIHFLHADNTLIPKHVMKKALQYEYDNYDFILVDDYFLSYVFSDKLNLPIWKIKADNIIDFTECAEDGNIALFLNNKVMNQRIAFYIYHMRRGWPNSKPLSKTNSGVIPGFSKLKKWLSLNNQK